jgi:hypothetical protein
MTKNTASATAATTDDFAAAGPITITLPATISFRRARDGAIFAVPLDTLSPATLIAALTHGFKQKFNDALNVPPEFPETIDTVTNGLLARLQAEGWNTRASGGGRVADPFEKWLSAQLVTTARAELKANKLIGVRVGEIVYHKATPDAIAAIAQHKRATMGAKRLETFRALFASTQATLVDLDALDDDAALDD